MKLTEGQCAKSGIRVRTKTRTNDKYEKILYFYKNSSPDSKADLGEKSKFGVWRLISSRYDIVFVRYGIILIIRYQK